MPAISNSFLFIEPMQHYLNYGSLVLHDVVTANKRVGQIITELIGDEATPKNTLEKLETLQPILFCLIGHGNTDVTSVECTAVLVRDGSPELELFKDKVISLCSCLTAQILGPAIIDAGASAYTGYKKEFWFYVGDDPNTTTAVRSPFVAEFAFIASLLRGKTTGEARRDQLAKYDEEINYWISGAGKDEPSAMELSRIIEMNKGNSVFLGVGDTRVSQPLTSNIVVPLTVLVPSTIVAILVYNSFFG